MMMTRMMMTPVTVVMMMMTMQRTSTYQLEEVWWVDHVVEHTARFRRVSAVWGFNFLHA